MIRKKHKISRFLATEKKEFLFVTRRNYRRRPAALPPIPSRKPASRVSLLLLRLLTPLSFFKTLSHSLPSRRLTLFPSLLFSSRLFSLSLTHVPTPNPTPTPTLALTPSSSPFPASLLASFSYSSLFSYSKYYHCEKGLPQNITALVCPSHTKRLPFKNFLELPIIKDFLKFPLQLGL